MSEKGKKYRKSKQKYKKVQKAKARKGKARGVFLMPYIARMTCMVENNVPLSNLFLHACGRTFAGDLHYP